MLCRESREQGNGGAEMTCSKVLSLSASKDRDFLLSPTGGPTVKISQLQGKIIAIYFAANWCQPCRSFTPTLADAYHRLKGRDPAFELVLVSCDEDAAAFDNHRALLPPCLAIPFSDLETKRSLNRRFDVEDLPCLVILPPDDRSVILNGVDLLHRHGVRAYPFTKQRLDELQEIEKDKHDNQTLKALLSSNHADFVLTHDSTSKQASVSSLIGKTIGHYFSAQWCYPGIKFTPKLASIYQKINHKTTNHDFEIVFLSSDRDQISFDSYFETMPWMAMPYGDPNIQHLSEYFDVKGIPSLVILGPDGKTVTKQGRSLVNLYEENAYPFTEGRIDMLQREVDRESESLAETEVHSGHRHELLLVSEGAGGGAFICYDCEEQGFGWAYQCMECGYEVHPKCVRS